MSDPLPPLPASAPELVGRLLRWLALAALVLAVLLFILPLGFIMAPLGLLLIVVVALFATGKVPPSWLSCVDPKDVGKVGGALWPIVVVIGFVLLALLAGLPGLLIGAVVVAVLFGLGWAGIGPLAPLATIIRGMVGLIRVLPLLRDPVGHAANALGAAADAVDNLKVGLDGAERKLGEARLLLSAVEVPTIEVKEEAKTAKIPGIGDVSIPGLSVNATKTKPFDGELGKRLDAVQSGLLDARKAAEAQAKALDAAAAGLKALHDVLPQRP
ncbi:MAG: hypothetical protein EPO67_10100 [Reyranella sp.]|nr:MAG: hypothetical protein EPO67_10100 [Reyranella sp.]